MPNTGGKDFVEIFAPISQVDLLVPLRMLTSRSKGNIHVFQLDGKARETTEVSLFGGRSRKGPRASHSRQGPPSTSSLVAVR